MTGKERAARLWEVGCLLLFGSLIAAFFVGWWALGAVPIAAALAIAQWRYGPD